MVADREDEEAADDDPDQRAGERLDHGRPGRQGARAQDRDRPQDHPEAVLRVGHLGDEDGERHVYRIVGADEIDGANGMISWRSPIGNALLGKEVGDSVVVKVAGGTREIAVVAINYE